MTSPTLIAQIDALMKALPQARWYRNEAMDDDAARAGALLAFGRPATVLPRFADARILLTLDADPLGPGPQQIRFARDIAAARQSRTPEQSLQSTVEAGWTLTGALADHRLALRPELAPKCGCRGRPRTWRFAPAIGRPTRVEHFVKAAAADLIARRGAALVIAGPRQAADVHALCHWINNKLGAPADFIEPVEPHGAGGPDLMRSFVSDVKNREIETLFIIGANPAYDAPGDLAVADLLGGCRSRRSSAATAMRRRNTAPGTCPQRTRSKPGRIFVLSMAP